MRSPLGQFVFGFVIAFSPAPLAGFGAWALVTAEDASAQEVANPGTEYGTPGGREWSDDPVVRYESTDDPNHHQGSAQYDGAPQEMHIEEDCKRRKRKPIQKRPKPEREIPDL